ncbi:MAG: hypothetical protein V7731_08065 [Amphritea sp.]
MSNDECKACICTCQGDKLKEVQQSLIGRTPEQLQEMAKELEKQLETQKPKNEKEAIQKCADQYALQAIRRILGDQDNKL